MAIVTNRNPFGIDPNAKSPNRIRRNFQKLAAMTFNGASGTSFTATAPLNLSSGALTLILNPSGGLVVTGGTLGLNLNATGGLMTNAGGVYAYGPQQLAADPGSPGAGEEWFNTASNLERLAITPTLIGTQVVVPYVNTTIDTLPASTSRASFPDYVVNFPTGFMNRSGASFEITCVFTFNQLAQAMQQQFLIHFTAFDVFGFDSLVAAQNSTILVQWIFTTLTTGTSGTILAVGTNFSSNPTIYATGSQYGATGSFDITGGFNMSFGAVSNVSNGSCNIELQYLLVELLN